MANVHVYFVIEDLNLNLTQRQTLIAALEMLGPAYNPQPACLNHWRVRLDGKAAIFEALFNENNLAVEWFVARLADIFGINPDTIDTTLIDVTFDTKPTSVVTFAWDGTDYLRRALFGKMDATWKQSRIETLAYLAANHDEWEGG